MPTPKVIIFDVNDTLLDLAPLRISVAQALQGREDLLSFWFSTMLHYSLVDTVTDDHHDFGQIGAAALMMVAESQGIKLDPEVAAQFEHAGLTQHIDRCFSIEHVRAFKPDPRPFRRVLGELGVKPEEALMVAAQAWDLDGAKAVGLQTAFVRRPGTALYPNTAGPGYVLENLQQLFDLLSNK